VPLICGHLYGYHYHRNIKYGAWSRKKLLLEGILSIMEVIPRGWFHAPHKALSKICNACGYLVRKKSLDHNTWLPGVGKGDNDSCSQMEWIKEKHCVSLKIWGHVARILPCKLWERALETRSMNKQHFMKKMKTSFTTYGNEQWKLIDQICLVEDHTWIQVIEWG